MSLTSLQPSPCHRTCTATNIVPTAAIEPGPTQAARLHPLIVKRIAKASQMNNKPQSCMYLAEQLTLGHEAGHMARACGNSMLCDSSDGHAMPLNNHLESDKASNGIHKQHLLSSTFDILDDQA